MSSSARFGDFARCDGRDAPLDFSRAAGTEDAAPRGSGFFLCEQKETKDSFKGLAAP